MSFNTKPNPTNKTNTPMGVKEEFTSWGVNKNQTPYSNPSANKVEDNKKSWEDDDDEPTIKSTGSNTFKTSNPSTNNPSSTKTSTPSIDPFANSSSSKNSNPAYDYEVATVDENFLKSHEYEAKIVSDITQPGGARVKQSDQVLKDFSKACESFQVGVIGSLLFHKLHEDIEWVSKARTLFAIEIIVKNIKKFLEYFKFNVAVLKRLDFSVYSDQPNAVSSLDNTRNQVVKYIEDPSKGQEKVIPQNFKTEAITEQFEAQLNLMDEKPQNKKDAFDFLSGGGNTNVKKDNSQKSNKIDPFNLGAGSSSGSSSQSSDKNPFGISKPISTTNNTTTNVIDILDGGDDNSNNTANQNKKPAFGKFKKENSDASSTQPQQQQQQQQQTTNITTSNNNKGGFDPFGLSGSSNQQKTTTTTQPSNQSTDLLGSLGGINFSSNTQTNQNPSTNLLNLYQNSNNGGFNQNNGGFNNGGFNQNLNMGFNQNYFQQNTNTNQNMNAGFNNYNPNFNPNYNPNFNPNYNPNFNQGGFNYNQGFQQQQQQQQQQGGNFGNQFNPFGNNDSLKTSNGSGNTLQNPDELKKKKEMEEKEKYFDNLY